MSRRAVRIAAFVPRSGAGVRVHMQPLLSALSPRFEVTLLHEGEEPRAAPRPDWIALPDHDQLPALPRGLPASSIPKMVWIDDAHHAPVERILWLHALRPRLALFTQWGMARFYAPHIDGRPLFLPHGVDPHLFADPGGERQIDLLLYGETHPRLYPFRHRLRRILERMADLAVEIVPHPGYGSNAPRHDPEPCDPQRRLAGLLGRTKVALADGGRHHLLFLRYFEIPASGALSAGEMLEEHADRLGPLLTPLDPRWSDAAIESALRSLVRDHPRLATRRRRGCERARRFESWRARAEVLERALEL